MPTGADAVKLDNIDYLIKGRGEVTLGRIGPVSCAAVAARGDQPLAMLVRRKNESLADLLRRLDAAVKAAWEDEVFIDEING
jgi:hypothetical protein